MTTLLRHCQTCRDERAFDQPPCADGHDSECPEWVCSSCGFAIMMEPVPAVPGAVLAAAAA